MLNQARNENDDELSFLLQTTRLLIHNGWYDVLLRVDMAILYWATCSVLIGKLLWLWYVYSVKDTAKPLAYFDK